VVVVDGHAPPPQLLAGGGRRPKPPARPPRPETGTQLFIFEKLFNQNC